MSTSDTSIAGRALAAIADPTVLAHVGGRLGNDARVAQSQLGLLDSAARRLQRAQWMATARAIVPENFRAIDPSWIEAALADLPPRARNAVAGTSAEPIDIWLARRTLSGFVAMPVQGNTIAAPRDLPSLPPAQLRAWLERVGSDQLVRAARIAGGEALAVVERDYPDAIARAPRDLGRDRAVIKRCMNIANDALRVLHIGARAVAPHLIVRERRQLAQRLPRALAILRELEAYASDPDPSAWSALL
ncbi:MAG: hypothetical protein QM831_34110 [Kofleriaceae bacterium]